MIKKYIDMHTHTNRSDGVLSINELVEEAQKNNIKFLAITDHNYILPEEEFLELQKESGTDITLIRGSEVSCQCNIFGKVVELHVVALFPFDSKELMEFRKLISQNRNYDRRPYINGMIEKLNSLGVNIGTYSELLEKYGGEYVGRPNLASEIFARGYTKSTDEAMDLYIGDFGLRQAWVPNINKDNFCSLQDLIDAVHKAKGVCILAHLYYYRLEETEQKELLRIFRHNTGIVGGMETLYRRYDQEQREHLKQLSKEFDLFESSASDYHGTFESDSLNNCFTGEALGEMHRRWKEYYGIKDFEE